MLVLSRKKNESIIIDGSIEIKIIGIEGESVKIGIEAPNHIEIHRKEIYVAIQTENEIASQNTGALQTLKEMIGKPPISDE
ncbi:carbon storage regulator CsrA [Brevibacillus composti]|uniref:Translational regulator CsrA n=1 Tax=Brevibacillus composti TaxID=2796470 RepID=A0A7T5EK70_9BACL|nr:carbon storage regulator CsrA [Brevibacillus composti]QQE74111.1 carbon storage regulator CsrA [Brevibacillus composti]QUO41195.1 carbon storage regulator CsrA [Brevibacillus composti]